MPCWLWCGRVMKSWSSQAAYEYDLIKTKNKQAEVRNKDLWSSGKGIASPAVAKNLKLVQLQKQRKKNHQNWCCNKGMGTRTYVPLFLFSFIIFLLKHHVQTANCFINWHWHGILAGYRQLLSHWWGSSTLVLNHLRLVHSVSACHAINEFRFAFCVTIIIFRLFKFLLLHMTRRPYWNMYQTIKNRNVFAWE